MSLPTGTITFLFTDIEGSTRLWEEHPEAMRAALARHNTLVSGAVTTAGGHVFKTVGDAFCAAFARADEAVSGALAAQLALNSEPWPEGLPIRVRMGLHSGTAELDIDAGDYVGQPLNRTARLTAIGHGGQILLSAAAHELVKDIMTGGGFLIELGEHRLKDLGRPETVFQLCHSALPSEFPPLRSLGNPTLLHNLPLQLTNFIGRENELTEVHALLTRSRLVTLTGAGGCGKTRLAVQAAADQLESGGEGVWLVELAALSDSGLPPQTVADALGVKEEPSRPILRSLIDHLKTRTLLLILDNCEHLLDSCARLSDSILKECGQVRILATSRERLGIAGEAVYQVPSLSLPDPGRDRSPESVSQFEAVQLFADRAIQAQPSFQITDRNAPALASICTRLDGIPLAIELAAARVRAMPIEQIEQNLDHRFRLLTSGSRAALPRQQTLRSLIDWSYDLLGEAEKALLCRLCVFAGGWTQAAAQAVCSGEGVEDWETLSLLTGLVDKSLVIYLDEGVEARYRLLETVRQYAREKLEQNGEAVRMRQRHLDFFLELAETAATRFKGPEQTEWFERLAREHENLRSALNWCQEEKRAQTGLRLCAAMQQFWWTRGYLTEGRASIERTLAIPGEPERSKELANALSGAGILADMQGDLNAAQAYHEEGLSIRREIGDPNGIAVSLSNLGVLAKNQGDYILARRRYEESLGIRREIGHRSGIATSLNNLGVIAKTQGDFPMARKYFEESLSIKREIGDSNGIGYSLDNLGSLAHVNGDATLAWTYHEESLAIRREVGDRTGIAISLDSLGCVASSVGDVTMAQKYHGESLTIRREIGDLKGVAMALQNLGIVAFGLGDYQVARKYHQESLTIRRDIRDRGDIPVSLEAIAGMMAGRQEPKLASLLWGAAEALREEIGAPLPPNSRQEYDGLVATARMNLRDDTFAQAWAEGRAMKLENAITAALDALSE